MCFKNKKGKEFKKISYPTSKVVEFLKKNYKGMEAEPEFIKELQETGKGFTAIAVCKFHLERGFVKPRAVKIALEDMAQVVEGDVSVFRTDFKENKEGNNEKSEDDVECFFGNMNEMFWHRLIKSKACICYDKETGFVITLGRNPNEAETALSVIKKSWLAETMGEKIGGTIPLNKETSDVLRKKYLETYSKIGNVVLKSSDARKTKNTRKSEKELHLRQELTEYGKKILEMKLVQGTWGNLSVRLDDDHILVTPSGLAYEKATPRDMVKVNINDLSYVGIRKPTSEAVMHAEIYKKRVGVSAIVHFHGLYTGVFASCEKPMKDYKITKYELAGTEKLAREVCHTMGEDKGVILAHHGALFAADSLAEAVEGAKSMEEEAKREIEGEL